MFTQLYKSIYYRNHGWTKKMVPWTITWEMGHTTRGILCQWCERGKTVVMSQQTVLHEQWWECPQSQLIAIRSHIGDCML